MELYDRSKKVFRYSNAIKRKFDNKQVAICRLKDNGYLLEVINLNRKFANEPAIYHRIERGIVRVSSFFLTKETLEAIVINAIELLDGETVI